MKLVNFLRSHKIVALLFLFAFVIVLISVLDIGNENGEGVGRNRVSLKRATVQNLAPGMNSKEDVDRAFGEPIESDGEKFSYKSKSQVVPNEAVIQNNELKFFREIIVPGDGRDINSVFTEFGKPDTELFGEEYGSGDSLFVYLGNGLAYLGNPITGSLKEIWYFEPTELEKFQMKWASEYSTSPPSSILF